MFPHLRRFGLFYATLMLVLISLYPSYLIIDKPFIIGNHLAGVPALQGTFNENVRQHGYLNLKFGALDGYMKDDRCPQGFYINHPTLSLILHSIPTLFLGNEEWVIRSVALSFHILNLLLIYIIGKSLFDRVTGLLMVIVYAFFPVNMLYNTLPTYHGTSSLTAPLLVICFILKFDQKQRRVYKISFFAVYFLSLLHDWLSVVNSFIIICYYLLSRRERVYEGLFYVLALTVLAFSLNFMHIYILTGRIMVNELIGGEIYRASTPISYVYSDFFRHQLDVAFGTVLILAVSAAVLFHKIKKRNFRMILYSQVLSSLFILLFLRQGLSSHFFLFTNLSLLILMSITLFLKFFEGDRLLVALIVILMVLDSQITMSAMKNETSLEFWNHFIYQYELAEKFFASGKYGNNTLVLLRDPGFFVSDYHFGRRGYCYDIPPQNPSDYRGLKGFDKIVFIELNEHKNILIQDLSPVV